MKTKQQILIYNAYKKRENKKEEHSHIKNKGRNWNWFKDQNDILQVITSKSAGDSKGPSININMAILLFKEVMKADNTVLMREPSNEKIQQIVNYVCSKHQDRIVFSGLLYQKYWHILSKNITCMVRYFPKQGHLLREINNTYLTLTPKAEIPRTYFILDKLVCAMYLIKSSQNFWPMD